MEYKDISNITNVYELCEKTNNKYFFMFSDGYDKTWIEMYNEDGKIFDTPGTGELLRIYYTPDDEYSIKYNECVIKKDVSGGNTLGPQFTKAEAVTNDEEAFRQWESKWASTLHLNEFDWLYKKYHSSCKIPQPPQPPTPEGGESGETDKPCSNTGQFGGGGTRLQDIKLFLYANNVTKGTIKLSKPQVEVGTFATDWRPNPSDYVERNSPAYKEIKGLAIQHNKEQNKKYIEVQATDGTVYGVDLWGGDVKKLLEQQQAEIEELKKLVQTLETKINV